MFNFQGWQLVQFAGVGEESPTKEMIGLHVGHSGYGLVYQGESLVGVCPLAGVESGDRYCRGP